MISDDTQLTLATCEAIIENGDVTPDGIAQSMLQWYQVKKITGIGSSTLKALESLSVGAHWALAGRQGEYASSV